MSLLIRYAQRLEIWQPLARAIEMQARAGAAKKAHE